MGITAENVARQVADHPRRAGRVRRSPRRTRPRPRRRPAGSRTRSSPVTDQDPQGRHRRRPGRVHPPRRDARRAWRSCRPAFSKDGTVTAGNASGINDGAAAVVLMTRRRRPRSAASTPLARIASWATAGVDPAIMGTGPIPASRKALEKAGWKVADLDLVEANEAFAAQACAVNKDMGWDPAIVNVNGGAIAIGHPIGASGARILDTLLYEMRRRDAKKGLATLCIGGGMGVAMCVERDRTGDNGSRESQPRPRRTPTASRLPKHSNIGGEAPWRRVALVTGGSRGIGAAISKALKDGRLQGRRQLRRQRRGRRTSSRPRPASRSTSGSVADYDACAAGINAGRGRARPGRRAGQQRRHHPRRACSTR